MLGNAAGKEGRVRRSPRRVWAVATRFWRRPVKSCSLFAPSSPTSSTTIPHDRSRPATRSGHHGRRPNQAR